MRSRRRAVPASLIEALEPRLQLSGNGIFVATVNNSNVNVVTHYGSSGGLLSTATYLGNRINDIIVDESDHINAFTGSANPQLTVRISSSRFRQYTTAGWSISNGGGNGGIATYQNYVFTSDEFLVSDTNATDHGIIRFDASNSYAATRYANTLDVWDLSMGSDGLLYCLSGQGANVPGLITVFNPSTMNVVRTVTPPGVDNVAVTADTSGNIYVASVTGAVINKINTSGTIIDTVATAADDLDMSSDNKLLARTGTSATIYDTSLNVIRNFNIVNSQNGSAYVAWDTAQIPPTPQDVSGHVGNDIDDNGRNNTADPDLANVRVYVDANQNGAFDGGEKSALTDSNGDYTISAVPPGYAKVRMVVPSGFRQTAPVSPRTYFNINPDSTPYTGLDFMATQKARISGSVYSDQNANGTRDTIEGGYAFFTVFLDDNDNGILDLGERYTLSDTIGNYEFNNITSGTNKHLRAVRPRGFSQTSPVGAVYTFNVSNSQIITGKDFGMRQRNPAG